jgi:hypothetical protein
MPIIMNFKGRNVFFFDLFESFDWDFISKDWIKIIVKDRLLRVKTKEEMRGLS